MLITANSWIYNAGRETVCLQLRPATAIALIKARPTISDVKLIVHFLSLVSVARQEKDGRGRISTKRRFPPIHEDDELVPKTTKLTQTTIHQSRFRHRVWASCSSRRGWKETNIKSQRWRTLRFSIRQCQRMARISRIVNDVQLGHMSEVSPGSRVFDRLDAAILNRS